MEEVKEVVEKNGKDEKESDGEEEKKEESAEKDENAEKSTKEEEEEVKDDVVKPRCLHKTASIFLRNLAPTITKQEVEAVSLFLPN